MNRMKMWVWMNLVIVVILLGIYLHSYQSRYYIATNIYPNYKNASAYYTDDVKARIASMPIQPGDSLKVDMKAYIKVPPKRGDIVAYYDILPTIGSNAGKPFFMIGKVLAFPREEVDIYFGPDNRIYISEVRECSDNISPCQPLSSGIGKWTVKVPKEQATQGLYFVTIGYIDQAISTPHIASIYANNAVGKVIAVTAPAEHRKKIMDEDIMSAGQ
ncbi:MAG: hypothetical protein V1843_03675 [bacterium]